ncbi:putative DNA repair protein rada [Haematococcus lacustris]
MGLGGLRTLRVMSESDMENILETTLMYRPTALVIDSLQTMHLRMDNPAGGVTQLKECGAALLRLAKDHGITVFTIGQVTKSSELAGPRALEHMVDAVLMLEGDEDQTYRLLRTLKNRHGSVNEVGIFSMDQAGLHAVDNPSAQVLANRSPGYSTLGITQDGSRTVILEVQALVTPQYPGAASPPLRQATGASRERLASIIMPVLDKFVTRMSDQNVTVNVTGGLQAREPATDLALGVAIMSSHQDRAAPRDMAFIGEVDLGGGLRPVKKGLEQRLMELQRQGIKQVVLPKVSDVDKQRFARDAKIANLQLLHCATLEEALRHSLGRDLDIKPRGRRRSNQEAVVKRAPAASDGQQD